MSKYFTIEAYPYNEHEITEFDTQEELTAYLQAAYRDCESIARSLETDDLIIIEGRRIKQVTVRERVVIKDWEIK